MASAINSFTLASLTPPLCRRSRSILETTTTTTTRNTRPKLKILSLLPHSSGELSPSNPSLLLLLLTDNTHEPFSLNSTLMTQKSSSSSSSAINGLFRTFARSLSFFIVLGCFLTISARFNSPAFASETAPTTTASVPSSSVAEEEETETGLDGNAEEGMYLEVLEKNPRNVKALRAMLHLKTKQGKRRAALKYVERLVEVEPNELEWRLLRALCYDLIGNLKKAEKLFREILNENPLLLRALHGLAIVMHKQYEGPAIFEMLSDALDLALQENRVIEERNIKILIAQMHMVKGEMEMSLKKFQQLVNEDPRDFRPYLCQGIIYSMLGMKDKAEEQFSNYQGLVPEEFPQKAFLDEVMISSRTEPRERLQKEFAAQYSRK